MNSYDNAYIEVLGQCKYRSSSISNQRKLSVKEFDRICSTIQLESSLEHRLGVLIANVSLSNAALNHFRQDSCIPIMYIQMDVNDNTLLETNVIDGDDISDCCITQILLNQATMRLLPNASVGRILLPEQRQKLIFSC